MCQIAHSECGNARRKHNAQGCQDDDHWKIATELVPRDIERCFKKEWRQKRGENEILGQADVWRERQHCQNDSCRNEAHAVREAQPAGQHCDDGGDQKQKRSGLKIEFHAFLVRCRFYSVNVHKAQGAVEKHLLSARIPHAFGPAVLSLDSDDAFFQSRVLRVSRVLGRYSTAVPTTR